MQDLQLERKVYSNEPLLKDPKQLFKQMTHDLLKSRELAWRLFVRNISAQYRQSLLGYAWAILPPVFVTAIWVFLNSKKIIQFTQVDIPYPVFVLTGTVIWQSFVDSIMIPLKLINQSRPMLAKINFPREALILASLGEILFNHFIRLSILFVFLVFYDFSLPSTVWVAPIGMFSIIIMGMALGILFTPLGMLYDDVERGVQLGVQAWFFITPVIYSVPASSANFVLFNPVAPLLVTTRQFLTTGQFEYVPAFIIYSMVGLLVLCIGWLAFRLSLPHILSRINA